MVYGDQVDLKMLVGVVYEDFEQWLKEDEMTFEGYKDWTKQASELMDTPLITNPRREQFPKSVFPVSLAAMAGIQQGREKGTRLFRALLRRFLLEGQDTTQDAVLVEAAREAGLDVERFLRDYSDKDARKAELEHQGEGFPHLPLGFYNLIVTDGQNRTVILDHAFKPSLVEEAIDYLSGGRLEKSEPTDIPAYLTKHGLAPTSEVARVFGLTNGEAEARLNELQRSGKVKSREYAGFPHWFA